MTENIRLKDATPLVKSVIALDAHFANLGRLELKLNELELKSEADFERARRLLSRFAECSAEITEQIRVFSSCLSEAQTLASAVVQRVSEKADKVNARDDDQNAKFELLRSLGKKVQELNSEIVRLRPAAGKELSREESVSLGAQLSEYGSQLDPLILEAQALLKHAQQFKMKSLEQSAASLFQTLQNMSNRLRSLSIR